MSRISLYCELTLVLGTLPTCFWRRVMPLDFELAHLGATKLLLWIGKIKCKNKLFPAIVAAIFVRQYRPCHEIWFLVIVDYNPITIHHTIGNEWCRTIVDIWNFLISQLQVVLSCTHHYDIAYFMEISKGPSYFETDVCRASCLLISCWLISCSLIIMQNTLKLDTKSAVSVLWSCFLCEIARNIIPSTIFNFHDIQ